MSVMSSQSTPLTPNSNCSVSGSGDFNNTTTVVFMSPKNGTHWATLTVSQAGTSQSLSQDYGNGIVIFKKDLKAEMFAQGDSGYNVLLSGQIQDTGAVYNFTGLIIYMSAGVQTYAITVETVESAA